MEIMGRILNAYGQPASNSSKNDHPFHHGEGVGGTSERIIYLSGEINESMIALVVSRMMSLGQESNQPIRIVISTYGGFIDDMFCLYDAMKFIRCPVYTVGLGKIMSAGVLLLAAGEKGSRAIGKRARIMIHPVRGGSVGDIFTQVKEVEEMQRQQKLLEECLVLETKMTNKQVKEMMETRFDQYIMPETALKLGIVDYVI